jgi:asparagine synthase (glutamine-hydrolysing)
MARAMSSSLGHRGPDDSGLVAIADSVGRPGGFLAHRRLAVIDLSPGGHQPMTRGQRGAVIAYNGEIYNFRELRRDLAERGVGFLTNSDTEVLLAGWTTDGPAFLQRLRGMFAFVLWDPNTSCAYLARDRFGIKPLYVLEGPGFVAVASEARALHATGAARCRLTSQGLGTYLATGSTGDAETMVEGLRAIPAGTWTQLQVGPSGLSLGPAQLFGAVPLPAALSTKESNPGTAARLIRDALRETVAAHLVSDVEVGVLLSGGLDSAALLALATEVAARPPRSFTVGFDDAAFSEATAAEGLARRFGSAHETIRLSDEEFLASLDESFDAMDLPSIDGHNIYYISRAIRRQGVTVALSGLGGDELFCGYPSFRRARISAPFWRGATGESARRLLGAVARRGHGSRAEKAALWVDGPTPGLGAYTASRTLFGPRALRKLGRFSFPDSARAPDGLSPRGEVSWYELTGYMRNTLLRDADVFSMARGLELRVPFVDASLADVVAAIDDQLAWSGPGPKPLLRLALRQDLPDDIWTRPKRGFTFPFATWLSGILRPRIEAELRGDGAERCGIEPHAAWRVWEAFLRGSESWSRPWALYTLFRWARERNAELAHPAVAA